MTIALSCLSTDTVEAFIDRATSRIRFAKAGLFEREANAVLRAANRGIDCKVIVEAGEQAVRLGLADQDGFELVANNLDRLQVRTVDKIRMALLLVDDQVLVFFPLALAWETESMGLHFPNGLVGGPELAAGLLELIDGKPERETVPVAVGPFSLAQIIPHDPVETKRLVDQSRRNLERNPAPDPTRLHQMTVYRNVFKLVRTTEKGVELAEKRINLARLNRHVVGADERLVSSWRVMDRKADGEILEVAAYKKAMELLKYRYVVPMGRFGLLIRDSEKYQFRGMANLLVRRLNAKLAADGASERRRRYYTISWREVQMNPMIRLLLLFNVSSRHELARAAAKLVKQISPSLAGARGPDNVLTQNPLLAKGVDVEPPLRIAQRLESNKKALVDYVKGFVDRDQSLLEKLFTPDELRWFRHDEAKWNRNQAELADERIDFFVTQCLDFPDAADLLGKAEFVADYYDVSDELLDSEDFKNLLQKPGILPDQLRHDEDAYGVLAV